MFLYTTIPYVLEDFDRENKQEEEEEKEEKEEEDDNKDLKSTCICQYVILM